MLENLRKIDLAISANNALLDNQDLGKFAKDIIYRGRQKYRMDFDNSIYIHVANYLKTLSETYPLGDTAITPRMIRKLKNSFPNEFELSKYAVSKLNTYLSSDYGEGEAYTLALILIGSIHSLNSKECERFIDLNADLINILTYSVAHEIDCERTLDHIKYVAHRVISKTIDYQENDFEMYELVKEKYPTARKYVKRISSFISEKHNYDLSTDEITYLMLHIRRLQ